jgi:hypothetical protein
MKIDGHNTTITSFFLDQDQQLNFIVVNSS